MPATWSTGEVIVEGPQPRRLSDVVSDLAAAADDLLALMDAEPASGFGVSLTAKQNALRQALVAYCGAIAVAHDMA